VWEQEGGYTMTLTHDHADEYMTELFYTDATTTHKGRHSVRNRIERWI
jgi:hypothetical protein